MQTIRAHPIHRFFNCLNRSGFPTWFFYLVLLLMPQVYENPISAASIHLLMGVALIIFYLPLSGINKRLVAQKDQLLKGVTARTESTFERIQSAHDESVFSQIAGLRSMLSVLKDEREMVASIPSWPLWPGTVTGMLSALFLPTILGLVNRLLEGLLDF